jgi:hypothetical protein
MLRRIHEIRQFPPVLDLLRQHSDCRLLTNDTPRAKLSRRQCSGCDGCAVDLASEILSSACQVDVCSSLPAINADRSLRSSRCLLTAAPLFERLQISRWVARVSVISGLNLEYALALNRDTVGYGWTTGAKIRLWADFGPCEPFDSQDRGGPPSLSAPFPLTGLGYTVPLKYTQRHESRHGEM